MFVVTNALRGVAVVLAVSAMVASVRAQEEIPPENIRGTTYDGGPKNYFAKGENSESGAKKDEKKETKDDKKEKDAEKKEKVKKDKEKKEEKKADTGAAPAATAAASPAAPASPWGDSALSKIQFGDDKPAATPALSQYQKDTKMRHAVARLCTSGWREAHDELVRGGKESVPYLLEAMTSSQNAYHNGGHTKADASRALRQRPLSEVCSEILRTIVMTRSSYKGELPGSDAQAWQTWFSTQGAQAFAN